MKYLCAILAAICLVASAATNAAIAPQTPANPKSAIVAGVDAISIPRMLSYQGKLTDTLGVPVMDTTHSVTFRLYDVPSGGSSFWNEIQSVRTTKGLFSVLLGSVTPVGSVPDAGALYLGMEVGGAELTPRLLLASVAYAYKADTANYALAGGGGGDNAWVRGTPDSVLYTIRPLGVAKGGADNVLYGPSRHTHVNLGGACTTGDSTLDRSYCTVGGGQGNIARGAFATVAGGYADSAIGNYSFIGGGGGHFADGWQATVGGGWINRATGDNSVVAGGAYNLAGEQSAAVGGGKNNTASGAYATVSGGRYNIADHDYATVAGGEYDTVLALYSFAAGQRSVVPVGYTNSAAFNGQTVTASNQTRVGALSKASGTFTIDHPLNPQGKILNHYFIEGPEMLNIYRGSVVLSAAGRAEVSLPDYFDALNRNPQVVLTGIGSSDVYLVSEVSGSRFTVGGKPGTKVNWIATGERKDVSAEVTRRMMPVEQPKTGGLAGRMLDDEFLSGCMDQLVREGKAQGIDFRTAAGRQRYEEMKRATETRER